MSGQERRRRIFRIVAIGLLWFFGPAMPMSYAGSVMSCRAFPDGDLQDVQVAGGLMSQDFVAGLVQDDNGLGYAVCGGKDLYFVAGTGRFIEAFNYDNGPDYFSEDEGLARFVGQNGLIGFVDTGLNIVLPAKYAAASPFRNGRARVSLGSGEADEEHWINTSGQIVVP